MNEQLTPIVAFVSCSNESEAKTISKSLVEAKYAACVKRFAIASTYAWNEATQEDDEVLLMIETVQERFDDIVSYLDENHSYDEYVLTAIPVTATTPGVLAWLEQSTS